MWLFIPTLTCQQHKQNRLNKPNLSHYTSSLQLISFEYNYGDVINVDCSPRGVSLDHTADWIFICSSHLHIVFLMSKCSMNNGEFCANSTWKNLIIFISTRNTIRKLFKSFVCKKIVNNQSKNSLKTSGHRVNVVY